MHNYSSTHARPQEAEHQLALPGITEATPGYYVPLPHTLLSDLRTTPAAIGAYALIGRMFRLLRGAPVFLSTNDLMAYDPRITVGSARRAMRILLRNGYVTIAATHGAKRGYIPTWGFVSGQPRSWDITAPILNRPPHIKAYRLDQRLLDICMGTIETHQRHAGKIDRYFIVPLLGLREIGEYALNAMGYHTPSPLLEEVGLIEGNTVKRLPSDQRLLSMGSSQGNLSPLGWRHRVMSKEIQALCEPVENHENECPLFFVPPEMIAGRIGSVIAGVIAGVIDDEVVEQKGAAAVESPKPQIENQPAGSHGLMNQDERDGEKESPPTRASARQQGGDHPSPTTRARRTGRAVPQHPQQADETPLPDTETVKLLRALGVSPTSIREHMDEPLDHVQKAVTYALNYPGARDQAALAVKALRDMRQGWTPPARPSRFPNQIAPRTDGPETWEMPEHDYLDLAREIMPSWALAKPFPGDVELLASIILRLEGDDRAALEIFARENWTRSGWQEVACA